MSCVDCGATWSEASIVHADTCPIAVGIDRVAGADRIWFEAHPDADVRYRPIDPLEIIELRAVGSIPPQATEITGQVTVTQWLPGIRLRSFAGIRWVIER